MRSNDIKPRMGMKTIPGPAQNGSGRNNGANEERPCTVLRAVSAEEYRCKPATDEGGQMRPGSLRKSRA